MRRIVIQLALAPVFAIIGWAIWQGPIMDNAHEEAHLNIAKAWEVPAKRTGQKSMQFSTSNVQARAEIIRHGYAGQYWWCWTSALVIVYLYRLRSDWNWFGFFGHAIAPIVMAFLTYFEALGSDDAIGYPVDWWPWEACAVAAWLVVKVCLDFWYTKKIGGKRWT